MYYAGNHGNWCAVLETRVSNVLCWKSVHQQTALPQANVAVGVVHEPADPSWMLVDEGMDAEPEVTRQGRDAVVTG